MKRLLKSIVGLCAHDVRHGKNTDPNASVQSQFLDRKLFEAAMQSIAAKKYADAVTLLHTLVGSYPDSPYVGRAKLALDDCSRHDECAAIPAQYEALPNGGGMIFFPAMPQGQHSNDATKKHQKRVR